MQALHRDDQAELWHADALDLLPTLPAGSVDALVTDPPYSSGGMYRGDRATVSVHEKYVTDDSAAGLAIPAFTGDNRDQRGYGYWSTLWLRLARPALKPGAVACVFTDWRQLPVTSDALQAAGYVWRGILPWYKPNGRRQGGRFGNTCEYIVWGTNGPRRLDALPYALDGFVQCSTMAAGRRVHITEKPAAVMRHLVKIAPPGGLILDPFAGSAACGIAAVYEGRHYIGAELDTHFAHLAADRLATATAPPDAEQLTIDSECPDTHEDAGAQPA